MIFLFFYELECRSRERGWWSGLFCVDFGVNKSKEVILWDKRGKEDIFYKVLIVNIRDFGY